MPESNTTPSFPVVGVGASAGGLAASTELLKELPPSPGVAIVMVHHLDPTHESSLVELFSRVTELPVRAATDGLRLERNHVYVMPPNAELLIVEGNLQVSPRPAGGGLHTPIDRFFESLALDQNEQAVGVLLSGSGADGSLGIKAIKLEGGITFAQDASAEYASMPNNAIASGSVDFVLAPRRIAAELTRIGSHAPIASRGTIADDSEWERILAALRKVSTVDFTSYKRSTIQRRVQRRVYLHRMGGLAEYVGLLERDPKEAAALSEEVLIHVTEFFRDPAAFDALKTLVFPKLFGNRGRAQPIRVWVPGCSTGEEVYSIAIGLLECVEDTNLPRAPIRLFGTDISMSAIDRARSGKYSESIESEVSPERLRTYFSRVSGAYQIRKDVRDLCIFAKHDATRDPPFSGMDLVSCRNLMIYMGSALQERLLALFHYALKDSGYLILGASETTRAFPGFAALDGKHKIYTRTAATTHFTFDWSRSHFLDPASSDAMTLGRATAARDVQREADRLVLAEFAPPGVVITDDLVIVQFRGRTSPYLEPAPGVASFELLRMARDELRLALRQTIDEARQRRAAVQRKGVLVAGEPSQRVVNLEVIPFTVSQREEPFFIVLFDDATPGTVMPPTPANAVPGEPVLAVETQLRNELAATTSYLESVIEQLQASNEQMKVANEEIVSANEELRSTNEELQMAKEELQATNEEMLVRNAEAARLNDDLTNVLNSVEIPTVLLGRDLRIRKFTPSAASVLPLVAGDVGRPISEMERSLARRMSEMGLEVLEQVRPVASELRDEAGHWYLVTGRPYLTMDRRIDGCVMTAVDVSEVKEGMERLAVARNYAERIVDTVRESLLVLDGELRVRTANRAFYETFALAEQDVEGRRVQEIGTEEWSLSELVRRIEELADGGGFTGFRMEQNLPAGRRTFLLSVRRIDPTDLILVAFDDVTEQERAKRALQRSDDELREMLANTVEAIVVAGPAGQIEFANRAAMRLFGYRAAEMRGLPIDVLVPDSLRESHALHRADFARAPIPRRMGADRKLVGRRRDGTELAIEVTLRPLVRDHGASVVCFITDVSKRRESEDAIAGYQEKLRQMAFDAAVAEERERRRIAIDLHDRIGQSLSLAQIKLDSTREALTGAPRGAIEEAARLVAQSIVDTRSLSFELSPPILYDLGLEAALSWLAEDFEKRYAMSVSLESADSSAPLDDRTAALLFRGVRELLMNVFKHADTPSAKVTLNVTGDRVEVAVADDGAGFDADDVTSPSSRGGFGLFSLREQLHGLGGTMAVASAPGRGTRVTLTVPLLRAESGDDAAVSGGPR